MKKARQLLWRLLAVVVGLHLTVIVLEPYFITLTVILVLLIILSLLLRGLFRSDRTW